MASLEREWAGRERLFRLPFGGVLDLEEACGDPVGAIFTRLASGGFGAKDVVHTVRLSLIGGGVEPLEAKRLVMDRLEPDGLLELAFLAAEILRSIMEGVEAGDSAPEGATAERYRFSEVSQICREFAMSPQDLREMSYPDFVNMIRGYNAGAKGDKLDAPTDAEFEAMLARDAAQRDAAEASGG